MVKSVFVTGGTVGSGLAIAERFAQEGYGVMITSRSGERAEAAARKVAEKYGVHAKGYALDIRDEQRVKDIFADIWALEPPQRLVCLFSRCQWRNSSVYLKQTLSGTLP